MLMASVGWSQITTQPQELVSESTASLRTNSQYFEVEPEDRITTLPMTSAVVGETSSPAVVNDAGTTETTQTAIVIAPAPSAVEALVPEVQTGMRLPIKVDKTSTASQIQQLLRFEKKNEIGEAFLLACEIVRQNPGTEFALDAAIRNALILRLDNEAELFYREAIRVSRLPGKYYVQLAHFYSRTHKADKLNALLTDYEKNNVKHPDYWVTLARLFTITNNQERARVATEKALQQKVTVFPLTILLSHVYRGLLQPDKARQLLLGSPEQDFGPWEKRAVLLEFLKLPTFNPQEVGVLVQAALGNEIRYDKARGLADTVIDRAIAVRGFHDLKKWLSDQVANKTASDVDVWMRVLLSKREANEPEALEILSSDAATSTPVISYERAMSLAGAKRYTEAIPILQELLEEQPTENPIRLTLAEQFIALRRYNDALQVLSALPRSRVSPEERQRLCELTMTAVVALNDANRLATEWNDLAQVATFSDLQIMGDIVLRSLRSAKVRDQLSAMLADRARKGTNFPLLLLQARLCAQQRDHKTELQLYEDYLQNDWSNVQLLRFVAELATQYATLPLEIEGNGNKKTPGVVIRATSSIGTDLAIKLYRRLVQLQPRIEGNYSALMRIFQMRGEVETAKRVAVELAETNTSAAAVQAMAAAVLDEVGFVSDAISYYRVALDLAPENLAVWVKFAGALMASSHYEEAEAIYRRVLEQGLNKRPYNQPQIFAALLKLANEGKRVPELIAYLDGLRAKDIPGKAEFYLSSSKLLMQVGADKKAEEFLLEYQNLFGTHKLMPDSFLLLGQLYYNRQQNERAKEIFQQVMQRFPDKPAAVTAGYNIGEMYRQTGGFRDAITAWIDLSVQFPNDDRALSGIYEGAIVAYRDLKEPDLSRKLFQQFTESGTLDFKRLMRARVNLRRLDLGKLPIELEEKPAQ